MSITDASASGTSDSVSLSVTHGSLYLGSTYGLTVTSGANVSSSMTVNGTLANLNAALSGLTYVPTPGYANGDTLQISVADANVNTSAAVSIPITITAATPTVQVLNGASNFAVDEDGFNFSIAFAFRVGDQSAIGNSDSLTFSATHGTVSIPTYYLSPAGDFTVTAGTMGSSSVTVTGPLSEMNGLLQASLLYTPSPGYTGPDSVEVSLNNSSTGLSASNSVNINVYPGAFVYAPSGGTIAENGSYTFAAGTIGLIDDAAIGSSDSLTLSIGQGSLTLASTAGLTFTAGSNGSNSMTVSGTLPELNAAVDGMVFTPGSNYSGSTEFRISASDSGNSSSSRTEAFFNVYPPPTLTAPSGASLIEGSSYTFSGGSIAIGNVSDPSLALSVSEGTLTLASTSGLTFSSGADGSSSMTILGSPQDVNAALSGLVYTPSALYSGSDSLQLLVTDTDDGLTNSANVPLTINAPPAVIAPATASVPAGSLLTFSPGSISVSDAAASATSDSLSLSVVAGTLTLGSTTGLTFDAGANGSGSMTVTGTLANLNAALSDLVYAPNIGYAGTDSLQISVNDGSDNLTGSAAVAITVNPLPIMSVPPPINDAENGTVGVGSNTIVVTDAAASSTSDSLTISAAHGIVEFGSMAGLTVTAGSNDSSLITLNGPVANLNAALSVGFAYKPATNYIGSDSLNFSLTDAGDNLSASGSMSIKMFVPPAISVPSAPSVIDGNSYVFAAGSFGLTDVNASGASDSLELNVSHGTLTLASIAGLTFTSGANDSSAMTVSGTLASLNAAVSGLVYAPTAGYSGYDPFFLILDNNVIHLSGTAALSINVLPSTPPSITAPTSVTINNGLAYLFPGTISAADPDATGTSDSLSLSVADGTLTLGSTTGLTFSAGSNNSASMMATGTLANLNAALNDLRYTPGNGFTGTDSLQISVKDTADNQTGSATVPITVNAPPSLTFLVNGHVNVNENSSYAFSSGILSVADGGASGTSDSLALSVAEGTITLGSTTALSFGAGSNGTSSMTITGTMANLNAALNGLVYTPVSGFTGSDALQVSLKDSGDNLTVSGDVVIAVNAPPAVTAPTSASLNENGSYNLASLIGITDTAAGGIPDQLTLTVADGGLTLGSTSGLTFLYGNNGTFTMTVAGSLANLSAALTGLVYTPNAGFSGQDSLQISLNDTAESRSGSATVAITTYPPPIISVTDVGGAYVGSPYAATGTVTGLSGVAGPTLEGVGLTFTYYTGSTASGAPLPGAPTAAGNYTVVAAFAGSQDYIAGSAQTPFTIGQVAANVAVTDPSGAYTGVPFVANGTVAGISGTPGSTLEGVGLTFTYYSGGSASGSPLSGAPINSGTYTVVAAFAGSTDYLSGSAQSSFTIGQAAPKVAATEAGGTYNGNPYAATGTVAGLSGSPASTLEGVGLTFAYYTGSSASGSPLSGAPTNAGTYTVVAAFAGSTDYIGASGQTTFTIGTATPKVIATDPSGQYTGNPFQASTTVTGVGGLSLGGGLYYAYYAGSSATGSSSTSAPETVGTDTVVVTFVSGDPNYSTASSAPVTFSITAAPATVTASDVGGTYTANAFPATGTVAGLNDTPGSTLEGVGLSFTYYSGAAAGGSPLAGAPTSAGTYTVVASFAGSVDYSPGSEPMTFAIGQATPKVAVTDAGGTYTGNSYSANATVAGVNGTPGSTLEGVGLTLTYYAGSTATGTPLSGAPTNAGTYTVAAAFAGSTDYSGSSAQTTFTIAQATPTVVATDAGGKYTGNAFPATATATGIGGASVSGTFADTYYVGSTASGTGSATAPSAAGTYTVVAAFTSGNANYANASSAPVTFSITAAPQSVTAPATASVNENASLVFSSANGNAVTVADVNAGSASEQVSLSISNGTLTLASTKGLTITSGKNGSASMTFKGTLTNLNAALNGLTFTPTTGYSGSAPLTVAYKNLSNSQTATANVAVTVAVPASQPTVTIKAMLTTVVPGQPVPLGFLVSDTNSTAQSAKFSESLTFGDGATANVSVANQVLVNHVYTHTGTFTVSVTAVDEFGHASTVATVVIDVVPAAVEIDPFSSTKTALYVGGTSGNDTVNFALSGTSNIAVTLNGVSEGVYSTSGPLIIFGQGGKDTDKLGAGLKNTVYLLETTNADSAETDLDKEAIQWAGLSAAVQILNE